ncbi:MAG: radical SAM protein [Pyrinomonadaceae bacterium]|nr:radical SAM protein [Pyrinomonadaceae bacterium]
MLRVTEIFRSIQGESTHAGKPCAFIRLTGCPMRCRWCDSEYTFTGGEKISIDDVLNQIRAYNINLVEVTGGEPLAQKNAFPLITRLCDENYEVLIETGGYVSTENVDERAKIILDVKCPTSGESERNHWQNLSRLRSDKDEIKFVVETIEDVEFARNVIKDYDLENRTNAILISPIFGTPNLIAITEFVFTSGLNVRLNLQLHKYVWGKDVHGV